MELFLELGFFSMADKVTNALGKSLPFIITGALIAAIWIYFLFMVPRHSKHYESFVDFISDILHFKMMLAGGLAKILYVTAFITIMIIGVVAIFAANFLAGLIGTILLQIITRVIFELFMAVFSLQENLNAIREKQEEMTRYDERGEDFED